MLIILGLVIVFFLELTAIFHRYDLNKPLEIIFLGLTAVSFLMFLYKLTGGR